MKKRISLPNGSNTDQRRRYVVNPYGSDHAAKAARAAVRMAFGRHAGAIDQADFIDRKPDATATPSPEARIR